MPETFENVWRRAKLEMPAVPPLLLRAWAQEGYSILCDDWPWAFLRKEGIITVQPSRLLTVTVTQGITTVTSAGLFVATDDGRQFRLNVSPGVGRIPIYTMNFVNTSTVTLDRPYADVTATNVNGQIFDAYTIMPTDFRHFLMVYDRYYLRIIPWWLSQDQLAIADPGRVNSDQGPRYLVAQGYSTANSTLGQVRYEYWPSPTSFRTYPYLYIRRADQLQDNSTLPGVLSERTDLLKTYCLWKGAGWPGTNDQRNPYFNLALKQTLYEEWEQGKNKLSLVDDAEYPQQLMTIQWARRMGSIAPTATLLRQTDATINDYY